MIIAITNHKGGVCKTSTAANLGAALAEAGYSVLLVDMDAQASLTRSLGAKGKSISVSIDEASQVVPVRLKENMYIVTSSPELSATEINLYRSNDSGVLFRLKRCFAGVSEMYDYTIIDCTPSFGQLTVMAMAAADILIVPFIPEPSAIEAITEVKKVSGRVKMYNPDLRIYLLAVKYDGRTTLHRAILEAIRSKYGEDMFTTVIGNNISIAEAQAARKDVLEYAPHCRGAGDYRALALELLDKLSK